MLRAYVEDSRKDPGLSHLEDIWTLEIEEVEIIRSRRRHIYDHPTFSRAKHGTPIHGRRYVVDSIPNSHHYRNVLVFIGNTSPSLHYDFVNGLRWGLMPPMSIHMGGGGVRVLLDGVWTEQWALESLSVDAVSFVDVLRWTDASVYMGIGNIVAVYTRTADEYRSIEKMNTGILSIVLPGYYQAREFYSPQYDMPDGNQDQDDYRTTLFWEPEIKPGDDGKATISFFTSDKASVYRVLVEGITETSVPIMQTKEIGVQ